MAEKSGKNSSTASDQAPPLSDPSSVSDPEPTRTLIRQRWELASALNFFHVFKDVIGTELKLSAVEIETALITPNDDLAKIHIALLKGIPPVNKNMTNGDAWVTIVCKKLLTWWPWVAEGDIPLQADQGKEIQIYKTFGPINRVVILKALCEVRAQQDDALRYISDELKKGTDITTFRKEKIGSAGHAVNYWYDGDPVMGHRLYKEVAQVESKSRLKGKGRQAQPSDYRWETLATELDEFQKISDNLSVSNVNAEAALSEKIKTEIVPVLQDIQKKKERALKRQQNKALQLNRFNDLLNNPVGKIRSCRERKPVRYTFDEYDRSIDEAIQISKKLKTTGSKKDNVKKADYLSDQKDSPNDKSEEEDSEPDEINENSEPDEINEKQSDESDDDSDYDENDDATKQQSEIDDDFCEEDGDNEESSVGEGDVESDDHYSTKQAQDNSSGRTIGVKKRLRQRLTRNNAQVVSDSEDSSQENEKAALDSEIEDSIDSSDASDD